MKLTFLNLLEWYWIAFLWITERALLPLYIAITYPYRKFWNIVTRKINHSSLLSHRPEAFIGIVGGALILISIGTCYLATFLIFYSLNFILNLNSNPWSITHLFLWGLLCCYMFVETFSKPDEKTIFDSDEVYKQYLAAHPTKEKKATFLVLWVHLVAIIVPIYWFLR